MTKRKHRPRQPDVPCACGATLMRPSRGHLSEVVPSLPLARFLERIIQRESYDTLGGLTSGTFPALHRPSAAVYDRAGISERLFNAWRSGNRPMVSLDRADEVIVALDALWFDVWNEDTVREPCLTVGIYALGVRKKLQTGKTHRYRDLVKTVRYGDFGTDYAELRRIQFLFEGAPIALAA